MDIQLNIISVGGESKTIEVPGGITWKEAKEIAEEKGVIFPKGDISVKEYNTGLYFEDDSKLPTQSTAGELKMKITAIVQPKDPVGGSNEYSYKDIRSTIKAVINTDGEPAKKHFNKNKNYTNKSRDVLLKLWKEYKTKEISKPTVTVEESAEVEDTSFITRIIRELEEENKKSSLKLEELKKELNKVYIFDAK